MELGCKVLKIGSSVAMVEVFDQESFETQVEQLLALPANEHVVVVQHPAGVISMLQSDCCGDGQVVFAIAHAEWTMGMPSVSRVIIGNKNGKGTIAHAMLQEIERQCRLAKVVVQTLD